MVATAKTDPMMTGRMRGTREYEEDDDNEGGTILIPVRGEAARIILGTIVTVGGLCFLRLLYYIG